MNTFTEKQIKGMNRITDKNIRNVMNIANNAIGYERFAFVVGYNTRYGLLDRAGKVEKTLARRDFLKMIYAYTR